jgi:phage terminase Nu1 subunit (DNA packaging protein)
VNVCVRKLRSVNLGGMSGEVMTMLPSIDAICTRQQLAGVLGVSDRQIDRLVIDHVLKPVRSRLRGKHFRLSASVQAYIAHRERYVTERKNANDDSYNAARTRRMVALAKQEELSLAAKEGEYLYKPHLEFYLTQMLTACRQRILAIPSRAMHSVAHKPAPECNRVLTDEVYSALTEISDARWKDAAWFKKNQRDFLRREGMPDDVIEDVVNRNGQEPIEAA